MNTKTELIKLKKLVNGWNNILPDDKLMFQDFGDDYSLILQEIDNIKPKIMVEIGSYTGNSSVALAKHLQQWGGTLICIDTWLGNPKVWLDSALTKSLRMEYGRPNVYKTFCSNIINSKLDQTVIPLCQTSSNAAYILKKLNIFIDCVYWDSGHDQVLSDLNLYLPLLSEHGVWFGDDFSQYDTIADQVNCFLKKNQNVKLSLLGKNQWKISRH